MFSCSNTGKISQTRSGGKIVEKYAGILGVPSSELGNQELYAFIDDWYGVKYRYGGMSKSGVDCSGFCNILYKQIYGKQLKRSTRDIEKSVKKIRKEKLEEGDLVFFNISGKKNSHVGVYLKNKKFVHASTSKGVIISSLENPYYVKAFSKGGRI